MKAMAKQGPMTFQPVDPATVDWSDMKTTVPKPTEDQLRAGLADMHN